MAFLTTCSVATLPLAGGEVEDGINTGLQAPWGQVMMEYGLCVNGEYPSSWLPVTVDDNLKWILVKKPDHKNTIFWSPVARGYKRREW